MFHSSQGESFYDVLLDCTKDPMIKYIQYSDIEGTLIENKIIGREVTVIHMTSDLISLMINDKWSCNKCLKTFEHIKKNKLHEIWATSVIDRLKKAKFTDDTTVPIEAASTSSSFMTIASTPERLAEPQPKLRQCLGPIIDDAKMSINKHEMKKKCLMYNYIEKTEEFEIIKVLRLYQEKREQVVENLALCVQILCASCLEIFRDKCPNRIEITVQRILTKIEKLIEDLAIDPSKVIPTVKSLLNLMSEVGKVARELIEPSKPMKIPKSLWNFKSNVKMLSLFIPVVTRLIEVAVSIIEDASSLPGAVEIWRKYQVEMKEALEFYKNLPCYVSILGWLGTAVLAVAAIGCGACAAPVACGGFILGSVGCAIATLLGKKYLKNESDSLQSEGDRQYQETLGILPLSTIKKIHPKSV